MKAALTLVFACILAVPVTAGDGALRGGFAYQDGGPAREDGLYRALGGEAKIRAFTADFVDLIVKDPQIGRFFRKASIKRLNQQLGDQFIDLAGGPVAYKGRDMIETHEAFDIREADFTRLVEDLEQAMDKHDVPYAAQLRLIGHLAPMKRAIVRDETTR